MVFLFPDLVFDISKTQITVYLLKVTKIITQVPRSDLFIDLFTHILIILYERFIEQKPAKCESDSRAERVRYTYIIFMLITLIPYRKYLNGYICK